MFNLEGLYTELREINIPVVYDDFTGSKIDTPRLPFISYYVQSTTPIPADNTVYVELENVVIELYTSQRNRELEKKIKNILTENGIVYDATYSRLEDEEISVAYFEFQLLAEQLI